MVEGVIKMYETKEVRKQIVILMLPLVLESFLQLFTNMVATAMVGHLSEIDISAQGIGSKVVDLVFCMIRGFGTAMVISSAKRFAQGKIAECKNLYLFGICSLLVITCTCGIVMFMVPDFFVSMFTEDKELIIWSKEYLKLLVFCLPFWGIMVVTSSVFQGNGNTKTPVVIAIIVNIINLFLCYTLIYGHLELPQMGYKGAALSLVISRAIGCIIGLFMIFSKKYGLFYEKGGLVEKKNFSLEVLSVALPNFGEYVMWQIATIILSRLILSYGQAPFAAYQLGVQAEYLTEIPAIGFTVAATYLISKAIAIKDKELFEISKKELIRICTLISIVTSLLLLLLPGQFMSLFTDKENLIAIGTKYILLMGLIQIPQNQIKIYGGILRSANYKNWPFLIQLIGTWGVRVPLAFLSASIIKAPLECIWVCIALDQVVKFLLLRYITIKKNISNLLT